MKIYYMGKRIRNKQGQYRKYSFKDTLATIARRAAFTAAIVNSAFVLAVLHPIYMPILDASLEVENNIIVEAAVDDRALIQKVTDNIAAWTLEEEEALKIEARAEAALDEAKAQRVEIQNKKCEAIKAMNVYNGHLDDEPCDKES